eukprot:3547288-Pyramimonas_sp.AAC.1
MRAIFNTPGASPSTADTNNAYHSEQMACMTSDQKCITFEATKWKGSYLWPTEFNEGIKRHLEGAYRAMPE